MPQFPPRARAAMLVLVTSLLFWTQAATGALVEREEALELPTVAVPLWQLRVGRLAIQACSECPTRWLLVDEATRYEVSGSGAVDRQSFVDQASATAGREGMITLFLESGTDYVRRLRLSPRPGI